LNNDKSFHSKALTDSGCWYIRGSDKPRLWFIEMRLRYHGQL